MIDFSTVKTIKTPDGPVQKIVCNGTTLWEYKLINMVPLSIESDGETIFNNGTGYKNGYRLSSSGAEKTQSGSVVTGFIPAKRGDIIRMSGVTWGTTVSNGYCYIAFYDANFSLLATVNRFQMSNDNGVSNVTASVVDKDASMIATDSNGVTTFNVVFKTAPNIAYIRISASGVGQDMIVTINQEIS